MFAELAAKQATMNPAQFAELLGMQGQINPEGQLDPETGRSQGGGYGFDFSQVGGPANPYAAAANTVGGQVSTEDSNNYNPAQWMADNGYSLWGGPAGNKTHARYLLDAKGNQVGGSQLQDLRGEESGSYFNMAAILGAGAAGSGAFDGLGSYLGATEGAGVGAAGAETLGGLASGGYGLPMAEGLAGAGGIGGTAASITPEMMATMSGEQLGSLLGGGGSAGAGGFSLGSLGSLGGSLGGSNALARIGGAALQAYTANKATNAQTAAGNQALDIYKQVYNQNREDTAPYRQLGTEAIGGLRGLMADPSKITDQPGYQFGMNQGQQAIERSAAARGQQLSGGTLKGLTRYGQDYAGTKLDQTYNRLSNLAGLGQVGQSAQSGNNYASNVGNTVQNMGNVRGSGYVAAGNAFGGALSGIAQNSQDQELLSRLRDLYNKPGP